MKRSFADNIFRGKVTKSEAEQDHSNLLEDMVEFNNKSRPRTKEGKMKKRNTFEYINALYEVPELTLNVFKSRIFPLKTSQEKRIENINL